MKPHRRKNTPPRREGSENPESSETPEQPATDPAAEAAAQEEVYHEEAQAEQAAEYDAGQPEQAVGDEISYDPTSYDPAQALVDPEMHYTEPNPAAADPGQAYTDPGQAYTDSPPESAPPPPEISQGAGVYDEAPAPAESPAPPAPAPRRPARKKVPRRRPAASGARTGSRYRKPKPQTYGGGVSVMTVFLTLVAIGMLVLVTMVVLPKDLSMVKGYPVNPITDGEQRNLLGEAQRVMIDRSSEMAISEEEVNQYLNHRLQGAQEGTLSAFVEFRGVYVDFSPDNAEIYVERAIFGLPVTMSSKIRIERFRKQVLYRSAGWSLGRIEFNSRNIKPVIDMFLRLRGSMQEEFNVMKTMADIRFEEDRLVLDSRI